MELIQLHMGETVWREKPNAIEIPVHATQVIATPFISQLLLINLNKEQAWVEPVWNGVTEKSYYQNQ